MKSAGTSAWTSRVPSWTGGQRPVYPTVLNASLTHHFQSPTALRSCYRGQLLATRSPVWEFRDFQWLHKSALVSHPSEICIWAHFNHSKFLQASSCLSADFFVVKKKLKEVLKNHLCTYKYCQGKHHFCSEACRTCSSSTENLKLVASASMKLHFGSLLLSHSPCCLLVESVSVGNHVESDKWVWN